MNGFVENKIQNSFTHKVSGTLEHITMMGNIINKARIKQRSLVITLLDLKNAFGEVHHNLISSVLTYHHVPENIKSLISGLYTNFKISIITDHYRFPAISQRYRKSPRIQTNFGAFHRTAVIQV